MSDFLTLTKLRRSVRAFQLQLPSEEALAYIMECVHGAFCSELPALEVSLCDGSGGAGESGGLL